jgi:RND superfamily putative drug exporter
MSRPKRNLAARAGYWSATHRKIAIGGWLAFVVIAFVQGGAIGTNTLSDDDSGNGSSRVADKAITAADFPDKADEQVLVQARAGHKLTVKDPEFQAAVGGVVKQLEGAKDVIDVESPLTKGNEGQISKDGRSALVTFSVPGDEELDEKVVPSLNATAAAQRQHPELRIEQFGDASADKALGASLDDYFKRA